MGFRRGVYEISNQSTQDTALGRSGVATVRVHVGGGDYHVSESIRINDWRLV